MNNGKIDLFEENNVKTRHKDISKLVLFNNINKFPLNDISRTYSVIYLGSGLS